MKIAALILCLAIPGCVTVSLSYEQKGRTATLSTDGKTMHVDYRITR